jgi:predicted acylesterase/phospholipase RssA
MSTSTAGPAAGEPPTAFVLAGGAALGAMQAGMIHALYERGIAPDLLIGTSVGALNAAFLASRPATTATAGELAALWRGLRRSDILPLRPATLLTGLAGRRDHLIPDQALRRPAARHLQFARLEQAAIPLHLVAFDLLAGTEVRLSDGPLADAVLAAAAIPGVSPTTPRSRTPSRSAPGASTCCPPPTPATAACRARPGPRWPPRCTRSPCSPTPACTATSPATPRPPS